MEVFMDDLLVYGSDFSYCLENIENFLERSVKSNLMLNWEKCHFMVKDSIFLGHLESGKGIEVDKEKIRVMEKLTPLTIMREVRNFLEHDSFYRQFIKDFSKIYKPIIRLLMKDVEFDLNNKCLESF